jgi:hypothetical protein
MSWITDKAINRIFKTFKRLEKQIFKEDIEALKSLNEYVENSEITIVNDNLLYSKLLTIVLHQNLVYYQNMQTAIKKTSSDLQLPLNYHLQFLEKDLNGIELDVFFKSLGLKDFTSDADILENKKIIDANQKILVDKIKSTWDFDTVEKSFYNTANQFLKDVNNYK